MLILTGSSPSFCRRAATVANCPLRYLDTFAAAAAGISWADWGLGREVASGKMVKWTVNKDGAIYLNNARNGWGWTRCKQKPGFRGLHVAAFGSKAFVASDKRRVVFYSKQAKTGACQLRQEFKRSTGPGPRSGLRWSGMLVMVGEDGETYRYTGKGWVASVPRRQIRFDGVCAEIVKYVSATLSAIGPPDITPLFLPMPSTSAPLSVAIEPILSTRPIYVGSLKTAVGQAAVWVILSGLDRRGHCLYRLRNFVNGQYLIAGDAYNGGLYIQPHQNRSPMRSGASSPG